MALQQIETFDDPRLDPYRNMKDKELARDGGRFIAEGEQLVRRLLASGIGAESLLVSRRKISAIAPLTPEDVPIYVATDAIIERVIGFDFHSGVLACGRRPVSARFEDILPPAPSPVLLMICQQVTNTENMGSLIRVAAGLGADGLVLGERCCDPFFRQSVRVSMGAVFRLPIIFSKNLIEDLEQLSQRWQIETIAAVLSEDAQSLSRVNRSPRMAVVLGSEADGLDAMTIARCNRQVTIPMRRETDSLNVSIAAAIFLYHLSAEHLTIKDDSLPKCDGE